MLKDEDADVRAAAVRALAALRHEEAPALMHEFLDDADPRVAVTAAVVLADAGGAEHARAAEATLEHLIADTRGAAAAARRDTAAALARIRNPAFRSLLIPLIYDPEIDVAREAVRSAHVMGPGDALFVPALVSLLGHRVLKAPAREALISYGEGVIPLLEHVLTDREEQAWVRRHVPATLALLPTQRSMAALVAALDDPDGFLRYKIIEAIEALRRGHPELVLAPGVAEALVVKESARYYTYLTLQYHLVAEAAASRTCLLARALDDKLTRTLDRLYRLLGLVYRWQDVADARYSIEQGDARARAAALEYLDGLLGPHLRRRVMPILDEAPLADKVRHAHSVLRTRPRDLADTVAQLVHEDDPVVAAAAVLFIEERRLWALSGDLEYVLTRATPVNRWVAEAAARVLALGARIGTDADPDAGMAPLPVVTLADRLRAIPLFNFVSVDELFRIAGTGQQIRYERGRNLCEQGAPADAVLFLLEGVGAAGRAPDPVQAPAALGFEDVLEGGAWRSTLTASGPVVCLRLSGPDFLTMISDNTLLAQGLFRMLIAAPTSRASGMAHLPAIGTAPEAPLGRPLEPVEKALRLRRNPLLGRATVEQLLDLVAIARDVPLAAGRVLFGEHDRPALYHVIEGEVRIEADGAAPIVVGTGATVGVAETLAGVSPRGRATVVRPGHALRLDREELFGVLADHVDLLQGVFSGVLNANPRRGD
jgi:CRP-like cAMP-binding protein/HEAT repeat protein